MSISEWARKNGFHQQVVRDLLNGKLKGHRGVAHNAAVLLGIKEGEVNREGHA